MYKVEITRGGDELDFQNQAILRRRKMDEERKRRIFDPKIRVIGIDVKSLEDQIRAKRNMQDLQTQRERNFDNAMQTNNTILQTLDNRSLQQRREDLQNLNSFRRDQQRRDHRREYDLNMPSNVRNQLIARENRLNAGVPPSVSGLQGFGGEDVLAQERIREQKEQMRVWTLEKLKEKKEEKQREEADRKAQIAYVNAVARQQLELEKERARLKSQQNAEDREVNKVLASWKHASDETRKRQEAEADYLETTKGHGDFLSITDPCLGGFKGLNDAQRRQVFEEQARQRQDNESRRRNEFEEKIRWATQDAAQGRLALLLEQEEQRAKHERIQRLKDENDAIAQETRDRNLRARQDNFCKAPTEGFFAQFNTSSR